MNNKLKSFSKGVGSLLSIYPEKLSKKCPPRKTTNDRMKNSWENTKLSFNKALQEYERKKV